MAASKQPPEWAMEAAKKIRLAMDGLIADEQDDLEVARIIAEACGEQLRLKGRYELPCLSALEKVIAALALCFAIALLTCSFSMGMQVEKRAADRWYAAHPNVIVIKVPVPEKEPLK